MPDGWILFAYTLVYGAVLTFGSILVYRLVAARRRLEERPR